MNNWRVSGYSAASEPSDSIAAAAFVASTDVPPMSRIARPAKPRTWSDDRPQNLPTSAARGSRENDG